MLAHVMEQAAMAFMMCRHHGRLVSTDPVGDAQTRLRRLHDALVQFAAAATHPLSGEQQRLLAALGLAAEELERLVSAGATGPVRSLGYAVHVLPDLIRSRVDLSPREFRFNFRVAAVHWAAFSPAMQTALCGLAGFSPEEAAWWMQRPDFAVTLSPADPAEA
jgi:hypothetical protein